jgi:hypothetical protein
MSDDSKELKIRIKKFLGSSNTYWQGNSSRIALPIDLVDILNLKRRSGGIFKENGESQRFLFFETDKGILLKIIDKDMEEKMKGVISLTALSEDDLKKLFE